MSDRRREKELKRKHKKERHDHAHGGGASSPAASRELVARELGDPQRLLQHLQRLSQLMSMMEELRLVRFPQDKLVPLLLGLDTNAIGRLPEAERGVKLRELVFAELVNDNLAKQARNGFEAAIKRVRSQEDQLAVFAGRAFMDGWLRNRTPAHESPAWDAIFGVSVLDAVFEGHLISGIARAGFNVDEAAATKHFTKALAKKEFADELGGLGLDDKEPAALAKRYGGVAREQGRTYLLGFDALLHLVRANHKLAATHVKAILSEGVTPAARDAFRDAFESSFKDDVTAPLAADLANEIARRLAAMKKAEDAPETKALKPNEVEARAQEKRIALTALASLRAIPLEWNAVLRNTYLSSFEVYKNVAPVEEVPFIRRIWSDPSERWALEEYEKFLMERRQNHRAGRVHRFLGEVRAELKEKEEAQAKGATSK